MAKADLPGDSIQQSSWHDKYGFASNALSVHAPSRFKGHHLWHDMVFRFLRDRQLKASGRDHPDLSIISWSNYPVPQLLQRCLDYRGLSLTVLRPDNPGAEWSHYSKVTLTYDWLKAGNGNDYILQLDVNDVLVFGQPDQMIERFESYGCDVLLGNAPRSFPPREDHQAFEAGVYEDADPRWRHINSGGVLARRDALMRHLEEIMKAKESFWYSAWWDDQMAWREMHKRHYPSIRVDTRALIFSQLDTR
jgi:hypothetical protein